MHESKGQHTGKTPSLHLFHTTVRQCMRVFLKRITNLQPLLAVHGCSLVLRPLSFSHVAWERPSWQHHAIKNLFNNLRPQFVDFQFLIRCFTCTQCGRAGITVMHLSDIFHKRNIMPGGSALVTRHCRRVILDSVQQTGMFVCVTLIVTLIWLVRTPLVCGNKIMVINSIEYIPCLWDYLAYFTGSCQSLACVKVKYRHCAARLKIFGVSTQQLGMRLGPSIFSDFGERAWSHHQHGLKDHLWYWQHLSTWIYTKMFHYKLPFNADHTKKGNCRSQPFRAKRGCASQYLNVSNPVPKVYTIYGTAYCSTGLLYWSRFQTNDRGLRSGNEGSCANAYKNWKMAS